MRQRMNIFLTTCVDVDTWLFDQTKKEKQLIKELKAVIKKYGHKNTDAEIEYDEPC